MIEHRYHLDLPHHLVSWPVRLFERRIHSFINRKNEESTPALSAWLSSHPEYPAAGR